MNARRARQRAQQEQIEFEEELAREIARQRTVRIVGLLCVVVALAAAMLHATLTKPSAPGRGSASPQRELAGIPQQGQYLGRADAPVTLTEWADLQCPFCATYSRDVLPGIIARYVRSGKVRLQINLISFLGKDSERAAAAAQAAARQNRMWDFIGAFYSVQGAENSGYVTTEFVTTIARGIPGLSATRLLSDSRSTTVRRQLAAIDRASRQADVVATPTFVIGRRGSTPAQFKPRELTFDEFAAAIDKALRSRG